MSYDILTQLQYFTLQLFLKEEKQVFKRERLYYLLLQNNLDTHISVRFSGFLLHVLTDGTVSI